MRILLILLLLTACVDLTGVNEEIEAFRDDGVAVVIICTQPLVVGVEGECQGWNSNNTHIRPQVMKWTVSDIMKAQINQDGKIIGVGVGIVTITGIGMRDIPASVDIEIT